jgi:hypothetical protein
MTPHEFGHAFDHLLEEPGNSRKSRHSEFLRTSGLLPDPSSLPVRISTEVDAANIFADMFLEWVRDCTGGGTDTMNEYMPAWSAQIYNKH